MVQAISCPLRQRSGVLQRWACMRFLLLPALVSVLAAGCDQEPASTSSAGPDPRLAAAQAAAETSLRTRLRTAVEPQQRGVQVFTQARPNTFAVCGRSSASGASSEPFIPYVAVIAFEADQAQVASFVLGATGPEATRVFTEMVDRCFDGGGPANSRVAARALPPLPTSGLVEPSATNDRAVLNVETASTMEVERNSGLTVVTSSRHGANIRSSPRGGEVLRTVPRSSTLEVLGEAPGGWFQVGQNGNAWGWVHSSVLEGSPR